MNGILICNGYVNSKKFDEFYDFVIESFNAENITMKLVKNTDIPLMINQNPFEEQVDFVLFLDKDIALARHLELLGYKVYNSSSSIEICDDKGRTHIELINDKNINMPKTMLLPFSYEKNFPTFGSLLKVFDLPFIVKERKGSFGEQVYLVYSENDWNKIIMNSSSSLLIQEYINYKFHEDYRVYVVGEEVICSFKRTGKDDDFRANVTLGGKMEQVSLNKDYENMAIHITKKLGLTFAGLDFIEDKNGKPIFIEANSNAHYLNAYKVSGINIASKIAQYIKQDLSK